MNLLSVKIWSSNIFNFLCIGILFLTIWLPEFSHYNIATSSIDNNLIQKLRDSPDEDTLLTINQFSLNLEELDNKDKIIIAQQILNGKLNLPNYPSINISLPFSATDLQKGSPSFQLLMNQLYIPDILLDAYNLTKDDVYFSTALSYVYEWSLYESSLTLPIGFLWNDHAIAARVYVFSKIWQIYRTHPAYNVNVAKIILTSVKRSAEFLIKPEHFTYRTNHGVMQNLALLHISVAFPELNTEKYKNIALTRLTQQLEYYISDEGVVLEHSAGYHELGVMLIGMALRYMTLLDIPIDNKLSDKYEKAKVFLSIIERPDNTLPMYGNTQNSATKNQYTTSLFTKKLAATSYTQNLIIDSIKESAFYPISGYYIKWHVSNDISDNLVSSQAVITWSNFATNAHKHADELSFLLWADNQSWWTNIGYWPYGKEHFYRAKSWDGSNAPHIENEAYGSPRINTVLTMEEKNGYSFIDLERRSDNYIIKRQILNLASDTWIVLDILKDQDNHQLSETWTSFYNINVERLSDNNSYLLNSTNSNYVMRVDFIGSDNMQVQPAKGKTVPFAGWIADKNQIHEAPAFILTNSNNEWNIVVSRLMNNSSTGRLIEKPRMLKWNNAEEWMLSVPSRNALYTIARNQNILSIRSQHSKTDLTLKVQPDITQKIQDINDLYANMILTYGEFKNYYPYRLKLSYILIIIIISLELLFLFIGKMIETNYVVIAKYINGIIWVLLSFWVSLSYFSY